MFKKKKNLVFPISSSGLYETPLLQKKKKNAISWTSVLWLVKPFVRVWT